MNRLPSPVLLFLLLVLFCPTGARAGAREREEKARGEPCLAGLREVAVGRALLPEFASRRVYAEARMRDRPFGQKGRDERVVKRVSAPEIVEGVRLGLSEDAH